jgi:hypothetical protein
VKKKCLQAWKERGRVGVRRELGREKKKETKYQTKTPKKKHIKKTLKIQHVPYQPLSFPLLQLPPPCPKGGAKEKHTESK